MAATIATLSTGELKDRVGTQETVIVDARPIDAYNGWKLGRETRGGHVKGAKSLPAQWTESKDWSEIVRTKGILPDRRIVVYGYDEDTSRRVAKAFSRNGFGQVSVYDGFVDEWTADPALPMDSLKNHQQLVSAAWVRDVVSGKLPSQHPGGDTVLCHSHYRNPGDYDEGHIPGAIALNTLELESPDTWNRRSPEELRRALQKHGITCDTTVILYGRFSSPNNADPFPGSSAGHLGAIRCGVIMMYAGVKDVRVLNGGIRSWEDAGYELTREPKPPDPVTDFGCAIPARPQVMVDLSGAKALLASDHGELVSVRSWDEFIGNVSGYNYIGKRGRIPGAVFGNCGSDAYHMENYRNFDHTTREYHEIEAMWRESGITPDKDIAFYCGTGWRASEAFFNAYLMGWTRIGVYDGGWFEWSSDPANPIESGIPA